MNSEQKEAIIQSISACSLWPTNAAEKIGKMIAESDQAKAVFAKISATMQNSAIKGGFAAETWHAESFNLDAILKDKNVHAYTDNFANTPLTKNNPVHDIVVMKDGEQVLGAQVKYYKNSDATQKAFRSTKDGVPKYQESDLFLAPSDQVEGVKISANKDVLKNKETRPQVSQAAQKVHDNTAGQIEVDGVQSTKLSKNEAGHLGSNTSKGQELQENMETGYLNKATLRDSTRAAGSAAVITAVTAGCINTFQSIKQARAGEITAEQAALRILRDTAIAAGDSALKAGAATAAVSIAARQLPSLFAGSIFASSFAGGSVAGAAICAVDLVQCVVLFAVGEMSREELETRTGKNILQTGAAVVGSSVGAAIGSLGGPPGTLIGSLVGGMITSLAMNIALDNHIEKNFKLTLSATEQVVSTGITMRDALTCLQLSQAYYADFQKGLYLSERHFEGQIKTMQAQSPRLKNMINKL